MNKKNQRFILEPFVCIYILFFCHLSAESANSHDGKGRFFFFTNDCKLMIDSSGARSPESAYSLIRRNDSASITVPANLGYISFPVWVLVPSRKSDENLVFRIKHSLLDSVEVFIGDSLKFNHYASCGLLKQKIEPAIQDVFPCFLMPKELNSKNILIKIRTSDVCAVAIEALNAPTFIKLVRFTNSLYGLYFGAVLILAVINFFLYVSAKYTSSLWYSLYILMFALFQAFALGFVELQYVFNNPTFLKNATPVFACLCLACGSFFTSEFLILTNNNIVLKMFNAVFSLFKIVGVTLAIVALAGYGTWSSIITSFVAPAFIVICLAAGIARIKSLGRPAVFYTIAISVLAAGIIINALRNFGIIPNSILAEHGNIIGSVFEFLMIAIALVDRVSTIEQKKNEAYREVQYANQLVSESRLKALQAQIDPHFLFNTMNTLAELVKIFPEKAEQLVLSLSKFFRYTLAASEKKMVKLKDEIDIVKTYLMIEKTRFGDRFNYTLEVDGRLDEVSIPAVLIQPIVENSIKHGISALSSGGKIALKFVVSHDCVQISILDNGPGFECGNCSSSTAHGLYNVKERLKLIYGEKAQLTCSNMNGALVELVIPKKGTEDV